MSSKRSKSDCQTSIKRRKTLTLESKLSIIKDFESGMKICEVAKKLDLSESTVRTIIKDKERILVAVKSAPSLNSSTIRRRHSVIAEMETILKVWCDNQVKMNNCPVNQNSVCSQARLIFQKLKKEAGEEAKDVNFVASKGWYSRFKHRCDWHSIAELGAISANKGTKSSPDAQFVFNGVGTRPLWTKMPKKLCRAKEEKASCKCETSEDQGLAAMLSENAADDCNSNPFSIYRAENPKSLKNESGAHMPVIWKSTTTNTKLKTGYAAQQDNQTSDIDSEDVSELLDSYKKELITDELVDMQEQSAVEQPDVLEPVLRERSMTLENLTEALSFIEKGLNILEDIDPNRERFIKTKQGVRKSLACYEEILREKTKAFSRQIIRLDFMNQSTSK